MESKRKTETSTLDVCRRELEAQGLDPGFADALAHALAEARAGSEPEFARGFRAGIVEAYGVHRDALERLRNTLRDVDEVGRLMNAFGGELEKLDEALRVLAAYLERMRAQSGADATERRIH